MAGIREDYFRSPGTLAFILVPLGMLHVSMGYLCPDYLPHGLKVGWVTSLLGKDALMYIFYGAWGAHVLEASIAFHVSRKKYLSISSIFWWTLQTFVYGFFSLRLLFAYKKKHT